MTLALRPLIPASGNWVLRAGISGTLEAARLMALAGAELLIYPTAIGWDPADDAAEQQRQLEAWVTVQRGASLLMVCRCWWLTARGTKPIPAAVKASPLGEFLCRWPAGRIARASSNAEETPHSKVDLVMGEEVRRIWPFSGDRRVDAYQGLSERWLADSENNALAAVV